MSDKIKKGDEGEVLAAKHLMDKGYRLLERNYRFKRSEIDLIVEKNNCLVFVEVKLRTSIAFGYPEEFVSEKKATKIIEGAEHYIFQIDWRGNIRYDIVAIYKQRGQLEIIHIEDAFC